MGDITLTQKLVEKIVSLAPEKAIHLGILEHDIVPHYLIAVEPEMVEAVSVDPNKIYCHSNGSLDRYDFTDLGRYEAREPDGFFLAKEMNIRKIGYSEARALLDEIVEQDPRNEKLYGRIEIQLRTMKTPMSHYYLIGVAVPKYSINE